MSCGHLPLLNSVYQRPSGYLLVRKQLIDTQIDWSIACFPELASRSCAGQA